MSTTTVRALRTAGRLHRLAVAELTSLGDAWLAQAPPVSGGPWTSGPSAPPRTYATVPLLRNRRKSNSKTNQQEALPLKNDEICNVKELRVVFPDSMDGSKGETKILSLEDAKDAARERNLDLVLASPSADPPVARITVWEKMIYNMRQKQKAQERAAREHRKLASPKEVRIGCHIAPHDLETKLSIARKILESHQLLKLSVTFKGGREIDAGKQVLDAALESLQDVGKIKDPKHTQRPQVNRWAVQLEPIP
mmetsp:Transcript_10831/g.30218  ORF Transcript_10831/g.30218 Transcript_10831/m.30218 type:complete len:252 (-) Transcript_10831:714-1469(-)